MGKKQRSKLAKAALSAKHLPMRSKDTDRNPFRLLDLPQECRDAIYELLLVKRLPPKDQAEYEGHLAGRSPLNDYHRNNAIDHFEQELSIDFDNTSTSVFLRAGRGLLTVNKQVREEASQTLFTKNSFTIFIMGCCRSTFWNWKRQHILEASDFPRALSRKDFGRIQHLVILVQHTTSLDDPCMKQNTNNIELNFASVIQTLRDCGNNLKTLRVRYSSCFEGEVEHARSIVDSPTTGPVRSAVMTDGNTQRPCAFTREEVDQLFEHTRVLNPLKKLKGRVEDVRIHGDMRLNYMYELAEALEEDTPSARTRRRVQAEEKAKRMRERANSPQREVVNIVKDAAARNPHDEGFARMAESFERMTHFSPSVMAQLMAPPTRWELERAGARF